MLKNKLIVLMLTAGSFTMALGLNCLPNIGTTFNLFGLGN